MTDENRRKLLHNGGDGGIHALLYASSLVEPAAQARVERMVTRFADYLPDMPPEKKAQLLYDVVTSETRYATDCSSSKRRFTWYSALLEGTAVCQGISELFYKLCAAAGVECRIIHGTACDLDGTGEELHAWNLVHLPDGNGTGRWYHCDATWDLVENGRRPYRFFLKDDRYMRAHQHDWLPGLFPESKSSLSVASPFSRSTVRTACQLLRRCKQEGRPWPAGKREELFQNV